MVAHTYACALLGVRTTVKHRRILCRSQALVALLSKNRGRSIFFLRLLLLVVSQLGLTKVAKLFLLAILQLVGATCPLHL